MVGLARSALIGAVLASTSIATPLQADADSKVIKKDVDTRYPYNGPTVVVGMFPTSILLVSTSGPYNL